LCAIGIVDPRALFIISTSWSVTIADLSADGR
jgi:hypothetical protein